MPTPADAALAALMAEHGDDPTADNLLGAIERFHQELGMALAISHDAPSDRLGKMLELAQSLADEPGSPTAAAWRAYIVTVLEARARLEAGAAGLALEAEEFLAGGDDD